MVAVMKKKEFWMEWAFGASALAVWAYWVY